MDPDHRDTQLIGVDDRPYIYDGSGVKRHDHDDRPYISEGSGVKRYDPCHVNMVMQIEPTSD